MRFLLNKLCLVLFFLVPVQLLADVQFGTSLVSEDTGKASGEYIVPNELDGYVFRDVLQGKKGVLISVGSFRTLHEAAFGDFSQVVMFDYDQTVQAFNRANLALIAATQDRYDYLAKLLNRAVDVSVLQNVRNQVISDQAYLTTILALSPRVDLPAEQGDKEVQKILTYGEGVPYAAGFAEIYGIKTKKSDVLLLMLANVISKYAEKPLRWNNSIFGSSAYFEKIKSMIQRNQFTVLLGDLTGEGAMPTLVKALKEQSLAVSVWDISNCGTYNVFANKSFMNHFPQFPFAKDAVILSTGQDQMPKKADDEVTWFYFVQKYDRFLKEITAEPDPYPDYRGMMKNHKSQNEGFERLMIQL